MIIGHGLIANAFKNSIFDTPDYVVFASGVSNSMEREPLAFVRERALLDPFLSKSTTLIYFSSTIIFDPVRFDTSYVQHKRQIEKLIRSRASSYIIVRLPILIGHTDNPHTLINMLVNAIRDFRQIPLHTRACRHLLDIDDLVPLLTPYAQHKQPRLELNMRGSERILIPDLVDKIESLLQKKGNYLWKDAGTCFKIPPHAGETIYIHQPNYIDDVLRKYFG